MNRAATKETKLAYSTWSRTSSVKFSPYETNWKMEVQLFKFILCSK